jgi:hypothetical protein
MFLFKGFLSKKNVIEKKKIVKELVIPPKYLSKFIRNIKGLKLKRKLINYKNNHHHTIHIQLE